MACRVILASGSPRRKMLLASLIDDFEVIPADIEELINPDAEPEELTTANALAKARHVASIHRDALVIGADTLVILDGRMLGKPGDGMEAAEMLRALSGRTHRVVTGLALVHDGAGLVRTGSDTTLVTFRALSDGDIEPYVATGTCLDKAGAYGIQDTGEKFVERLDGDCDNVVGLPLAMLSTMLDEVRKLLA